MFMNVCEQRSEDEMKLVRILVMITVQDDGKDPGWKIYCW